MTFVISRTMSSRATSSVPRSAPKPSTRSVSMRVSRREDDSAAAASSDRRDVLLGLAALSTTLSTLSPSAPALAVSVADRPSLRPGTRVFFDFHSEEASRKKTPLGRVVVEIYDDAGVAAQRFLELSVGLEGVSYRLGNIFPFFLFLTTIPYFQCLSML
jgi:hypothetical protein